MNHDVRLQVGDGVHLHGILVLRVRQEVVLRNLEALGIETPLAARANGTGRLDLVLKFA